jgi:hypothetical protein
VAQVAADDAGAAQVVAGDAAVPEGPAPPPVIHRPTRERSATLAAAGGLTVGFGFIGLLGGAGLVVLGVIGQEIGTCQDGVYGYQYQCGIGQTGEDMAMVGLVSMAIGGGLIAIGLPPLLLGSAHVPRDEAARPTLHIGAQSARVRVPF